ncbi:hypothetical protein FOZ63_004780 [Perkinsus olseni]|uniref:Uncharacterized protein n=1 Tax=Perkinsus olseni TaxID=32597 RepID=A0A7J6UAQ2_PEROL|nr:hypothetical protein FOZ63_004780 [Perkinsus olseni]
MSTPKKSILKRSVTKHAASAPGLSPPGALAISMLLCSTGLCPFSEKASQLPPGLIPTPESPTPQDDVLSSRVQQGHIPLSPSDTDSQTREYIVHAQHAPAAVPSFRSTRQAPPQPVILGKHPIPGYLVADLPRSGLLSDFLDRDWPDFIPAAWRRIKRIDKNQPSSLSSVSAILMAGLGLTSRLALANLIGPTVCMAFQARLTDAAFGRDGTSRARNAFEGALTELHSCVLEGRCPDIALAIPSSTCSHELEKILSKFRGFMPPPPAMPPAASTKGAKGKGGKGTFLIRSSNPLPPQDPPPAEAPQQPPVKSQDSSPPRRDSRSYY